MYLVDYSKWKKILIILMIINILWTFYNRVFANAEGYYYTKTDIVKDVNTVVIGNADYGGTRTFILPDFIFDYDNILISMTMNPRNVNSKSINIIFSNSKIIVQSDGWLCGEEGQDYYLYYNFTASNTTYDLSNFTLSNFNNYRPPANRSYIFRLYPCIRGHDKLYLFWNLW